MTLLKDNFPNNYQIAKEVFFERCRLDKDFEERMIQSGILVREENQTTPEVEQVKKVVQEDYEFTPFAKEPKSEVEE